MLMLDGFLERVATAVAVAWSWVTGTSTVALAWVLLGVAAAVSAVEAADGMLLAGGSGLTAVLVYAWSLLEVQRLRSAARSSGVVPARLYALWKGSQIPRVAWFVMGPMVAALDADLAVTALVRFWAFSLALYVVWVDDGDDGGLRGWLRDVAGRMARDPLSSAV